MPYDAKLLRRTLTFLLRSQARPTRVLSPVIALAGLLMAMLDNTNFMAYVLIADRPAANVRGPRLHARAWSAVELGWFSGPV